MKDNLLINKEEKKGTKAVEISDGGLGRMGGLEGSGTFRVVITKEANDALESAVNKVGEGFDAGTITKSDIANYLFQNMAKFFLESDFKALRALHFDEKKVLGSFLKSDSDLPEELKKAIRLHYGITDKEKKKSSRSAQDLSTD